MNKKTSLYLSFLVLAFGFCMAGLSLFFMLEKQESILKAQVLSQANELKDDIQRELLRSENVLRGIEGLFQSSDAVTRNEYERFCKSSIQKEIPFHLVEWQPKVLEEEVKEYEKTAREDGVKNFKFFEIGKDGKEIPVKVRPYHFPVYYSYSPEIEYQAVGLDLAFSPLRMRSKFKSMKLGAPVASGTFDVIVKSSKKLRRGFAITHSIFNEASISASESLKHLKGFVAIVLYVDDFFKSLVKPQDLKYFQFEVVDEGDGQRSIYSSLKKPLDNQAYSRYLTLNVGNRNWGLKVYPTQNFLSDQNILMPWLIFIMVLLLSTALAFYIYFKNSHQEKINAYKSQLQQKQRLESLGVLASGVAHEFNNILQCITLATENLKYSRSEENKEEYIETSLEYCHRGRGLIRQILSFARQDSGSLKSMLPSLEIKKTMSLIETSLLKDITFHIEIEDIGDTQMQMNPNHISQILINLCNNAAYAMQGKGHVEVHYYCTESERVLTVKDNGVGMDEEVCQRIFDPFFSTKPVNEGTGLGLSVIYGIVKSYHGEITVTSKPGKGTEFKITLPVA